MSDDMKRYILLPASGFELNNVQFEGPSQSQISAASVNAQTEPTKALAAIEVLGQAGSNGPLVVEMEPEQANVLRRESRIFRVAPERKYRQCMLPVPAAKRQSNASSDMSGPKETTKIKVVDNETDQPVQGVDVVVYSNRDTRTGIRRRTGKSGQATVTLTNLGRIDEVLLFPDCDYWGLQASNVSLHSTQEFRLKPIESFDGTLLVDRYFRPSEPSDGKGVKVAVIDSGIDHLHPQLRKVVAHHEASVLNDTAAPGQRYANGHGTHVAGIIGAKDFGLAPAVKIYDYRVFAPGRPTASNGDILRAIYRAANEGCDLINLSLAGGAVDEALNVAIGYAREKGCVCFVAAGNRSRSAVDYPGSFKRSYAVTAYGHRHSMPHDAVQLFDPKAQYSTTDDQLFIGGFSNIGPETDFTGPGVGVVSTWPSNRMRVESGTSMATPAITGLAARFLSRTANRTILKGKRDIRRAMKIVDLVHSAARDMGFSMHQQGYGAPQE